VSFIFRNKQNASISTSMAIISVLVGSVREGRQGIKVANYVRDQLKTRGHQVHFIDPLEYKSLLVFQDRYVWQKNPSAELTKVRDLLKESDGFFLVTPEYNYSYSPAIKQILDTFYLTEYRAKPFGLVSYSGGPHAGVRAIEQLKLAVTAIGGVPVAAYWGVPFLQNQFDEQGKLKDEALQKGFDHTIKEFEWYTAALANHRKLDPSILQ
jgi:NAD(P)H-dependent FMN reductase